MLPRAVIAPALTLQLPSPASHCAAPLFGRPPLVDSSATQGKPFQAEERSVCVLVRVEYACLGETGCCRHLPTATPLLLLLLLPLSLRLIVEAAPSDWWKGGHSRRGNGRHCWSICSATHCPTCLLLWKEDTALEDTEDRGWSWMLRCTVSLGYKRCLELWDLFFFFFLSFTCSVSKDSNLWK